MRNNRYGQAKVLDIPELDLLKDWFPSQHHQALAIAMRNTGVRVGEIIKLPW